VPVTRDYRDELKTAGLVALAPIIAAVPVGILWWLVAPVARLHYVDGSVLLSEGEGESAVAADGWFAVCAAVAGLVCAALVFARLRRARIGALVGLAVGGLLAAVLAWRLGVLLGPGSIRDSIKGLHSGAFFDGPLDVSAKGVLLLWPLASVRPRATGPSGPRSPRSPTARWCQARSSTRRTGATVARVSRTRSPGASETSRPRRPPDTRTVSNAVADSSTTVGSALRWPSGLMPPTTYPVTRSASAGSAISARLPPTAAARAFRSSVPLTGTTATTSRRSTLASSVLNTRSGATPSAAAASSP
jgi:hypothetical protein